MIGELLAACAAFLIAFVCATGGVTGAFLLVPFQIGVLGLAGPPVSATNHLYNVVAAPGGLSGYWRQGRLVGPVAGVLIAGSVPGIILGTVLRVRVLTDPARFRPFVGVVLLVLGLSILARLARRGGGRAAPADAGEGIERLRFDAGKLVLRFRGRVHSVRVPALFLFSVLVGIIGGAYGVGGGVFTAAYLVGVCGLPVHATAGATLLATFVSSCTGTAAFALLHGSSLGGGSPSAPDWSLGLAMGVGGLLGGYLGSRVQRYLPSDPIALVLALILLALGGRYLLIP